MSLSPDITALSRAERAESNQTTGTWDGFSYVASSSPPEEDTNHSPAAAQPNLGNEPPAYPAATPPFARADSLAGEFAEDAEVAIVAPSAVRAQVAMTFNTAPTATGALEAAPSGSA